METTLGGVRDYYVLVLDSERFKRAIDNLDRIRKVETEHISEIWIAFSKNLTYPGPSGIRPQILQGYTLSSSRRQERSETT